jgi:uncharacterized protein YndB with AHSA1/START domain
VTEHTEPKPYDVEQPVAAGRYTVWEAVTQPPVVRQWFGWDYPGVEAEIQQIFVDEAILTAPERMGWADGSFLEVTGDDERSTVRAVRAGDPDADPERYDALEQGWRMFLAQLRFLVEERPQGVRRTVFLTGATTGRRALELAGGEPTRLDSRVAQVVTGSGELLLIAGEEPLDSPRAGLVQVVVSTFGLDEEGFAEVLGRWTAQWPAVAERAEITIAPAS